MTADKTGPDLVPDADAIAWFRDRPGVWLTFAGSAFLIRYADMLRGLNMKPSWVTALALLDQHPAMTQSALGRALRINRASSMVLATLLEAAGYATRTAATGRQRTLLRITPLGIERLAAACAIERELIADIADGIDDDAMARFVKTLQRITRRLNGAPPG